MNKKLVPVLLVICGVVLASGIPNAVQAEFNLEKLKTIADKAKSYQEKIQQTQATTSSPQSPDSGVPESSGDSNNAAVMQPQKVDVVGVKLGMSPDDALKALRIHNSKLKIVQERKLFFEDFKKQNHPWEIILEDESDASKKTKETIRLYVSLPPNVGVVQVIRDLEYPYKVGGPTVDAVMSTLQEKYGNPTKNLNQPVNSHLIWNYDHTKKGFPHPNDCHPDSSVFYNLITIYSHNPLPKDRCGLTLFSLIDKVGGNPGVTQKIRIQLTDHALIYRLASESVEEFKQIEQRRKNQEIGRANQREVPKF